jgi:hypothetical protein
MALAYLFECHFKDGTVLQQTQEDISTIDPTRSAFYDVLQRKNDIEVFGIFNDHHTYAVDLRDGHFEIDGAAFNISPNDSFSYKEHHDYRVIYFRRHQHTVVTGADSSDDLFHTITFHIGWQTTLSDGSNVQQTISVS